MEFNENEQASLRRRGLNPADVWRRAKGDGTLSIIRAELARDRPKPVRSPVTSLSEEQTRSCLRLGISPSHFLAKLNSDAPIARARLDALPPDAVVSPPGQKPGVPQGPSGPTTKIMDRPSLAAALGCTEDLAAILSAVLALRGGNANAGDSQLRHAVASATHKTVSLRRR
jgi:hypothetical protein